MSDRHGARLRIFLVAGEPSGDVLGAKLMAALRTQAGEAVEFAGVGGERMTATSLAHAQEMLAGDGAAKPRARARLQVQ